MMKAGEMHPAQLDILRTIDKVQKKLNITFVPDTLIAEELGLPPPEVRDHLPLMEAEGLVTLGPASGGYIANLAALGRMMLREQPALAIMGGKQ